MDCSACRMSAAMYFESHVAAEKEAMRAKCLYRCPHCKEVSIILGLGINGQVISRAFSLNMDRTNVFLCVHFFFKFQKFGTL